MIRWIPYAFVRIVFFFIIGIALGIYFPTALSLSAAAGVLLILASTYLIIFFLSRSSGSAPMANPGVIGLVTILVAGYTHTGYQTRSSSPDHIAHLDQQVECYEVVITRYSEEKTRSWKTEGAIRRVRTDHWKKADGKVMLYFSKDEFGEPYRYGDVLLVKGAPAPVQGPVNPGEFDYQRYLFFKNIYHQHFLVGDDVQKVRNDRPSVLMAWAIGARVWADAALEEYVTGEREQAIASALVLGVTDGLDNELLDAYAATGAMHVLAVSGLHITIIYMILLWMLKPLLRFGWGKWGLAIISLAILWSYAFITGLSPSVLRAVTMFSFIAIARPASQSTNIYNTLAASAFLLLLVDPFLIMSVGFQLSYLAVLGIVYLHPRFYALWEAPNRFLDEVWKITSVSAAAQIATFSLGLLYFHQFPNYFLISNLLVIPCSFAVLIAGIVVLAVSSVPAIAVIVGWVVTWLIKVLNAIVFTVESFPFSMVSDIHITIVQSWLLAGITLTIILLFEWKQYSYLWATAFLVVLFAIAQWNHYNENVSVSKFTVYSVRGHSAVDLMERGKAYFLADSQLINDDRKIRFHIAPNRLASRAMRVESVQSQPFVLNFEGARLIRWRGQLILQVFDKVFRATGRIEPDWVIVGNNALPDLGMLSLPENAKVILDSSNSRHYTERMIRQAQRERIDVYSVLHRGAFEARLSTGT